MPLPPPPSSSAADWTIVALDSSDPVLSNIGRYNVQLLDVNGLPYAQGQGSAGGAAQRVLLCASSVTPSAGDWTVYGLGDDESGFASYYGGILSQGPSRSCCTTTRELREEHLLRHRANSPAGPGCGLAGI